MNAYLLWSDKRKRLSNMAVYKKLGVIGGLGPAATALFFQRVVEYTDVSSDQDHLDIDILNRPGIPNRTDYLLGVAGAPSFVPSMNEVALQLEALGCTVLSTPCNTAHAELAAIAQGLTTAYFVNMLDETASFVKRLGATRCAILATDGTLETKVYERALAAYGIAACAPRQEDQKQVMSIIYDQVKAGIDPDSDSFLALCGKMIDAGCDGIILGCTELSLIPVPVRMGGVPIVDALNVLAWRCVQECGAPAKDLMERYR